MKERLLIIILIYGLLPLMKAQGLTQNKIDSFVSLAISISENLVYEGRFQEAKKILRLSNFDQILEGDKKNEIKLVIQDIRVQGFMNIVYLLKSDPTLSFERLNNLLVYVADLNDSQTQADFYLSFSSACRSTKKAEMAVNYEEKALEIYNKIGRLDKVAELRANRISRHHNRLLIEGKKAEILEFIPKYQEEIKFSEKHSKYALAYNTRHLAQIHRRQTLNYEESLKHFKTSLLLREEIGFRPFLPASYSSMGDVFTKLENYKAAIEMYSETKRLAEEIGFIRYQINPLINIADIYIVLGEKEKAMEYLKDALKIASETRNLERFEEIVEKITGLDK